MQAIQAPRNLFPEAKVHPAIAEKIANYRKDQIAQVQSLIAAQRVVIVGMAQNPHPKKARRLLNEKKVSYEYLEIGSYLSGYRPRLALKMWTGWPTFPMIFVDGTLIGGASDLQNLADSGELEKILSAPRAVLTSREIVSGRSRSSNAPPCRCCIARGTMPAARCAAGFRAPLHWLGTAAFWLSSWFVCLPRVRKLQWLTPVACTQSSSLESARTGLKRSSRRRNRRSCCKRVARNRADPPPVPARSPKSRGTRSRRCRRLADNSRLRR